MMHMKMLKRAAVGLALCMTFSVAAAAAPAQSELRVSREACRRAKAARSELSKASRRWVRKRPKLRRGSQPRHSI